MARAVVALLVMLFSARAASADEVARVRAHLRAASVRLEQRNLSGLTTEQRARRTRAIASLNRYIARGVFPRRTGDPYKGLRPRFVDDRGVHCAVGQMLADSGASELAREINAQYEYAYVPEMTVPALVAWAETHGFTVDELAMIQPAYSPPTNERHGLRMHILMEMPRLVFACIGKAPLPAQVELSGRMDRSSSMKVEAKSQDDFSRCFADQVAKMPGAKMFVGPETYGYLRSMNY